MSMTLEKALQVLRANQEMLRARGVLHAAVFGSVVRGDARPGSDVDVMVDIEPERRLSLFDFARIQSDLEEMFQSKVDLAERKALKRFVKEQALSEKADAF